MRRVVFNQKGGVGKTTIVCNLAAISASRGRKTLVVDLDAQCNASQYLLSSGEAQAEAGTADYFEETLKRGRQSDDLSAFITETPFENLHLMAAHPDLEELRVKLEAKHKIYKLRQALDKLEGYDAIYIDTPPALNFYSQSALIAATHCLVPFDCDDFARQALYNLFDTIDEIQEDHNPALAVDGIVVNQFQTQAKLPARVIAELKAEGHPLLDAAITSSVKVRESHEASVPLVYLAPGHKVSKQYAELYDALQG
ncbi:cobyrinic acid a,c-diamide synthase [Salinisphaera sp. PC39]|uniref:ParA family protein n=1 Tax=Salinisphaera sp. PC39 TaxID=1304156 RepID=UPI00333E533C